MLKVTKFILNFTSYWALVTLIRLLIQFYARFFNLNKYFFGIKTDHSFIGGILGIKSIIKF